MLKVCHFISGDLWAGAEVMAYNLLRGLQPYEGLSLSVILFNEGRLAKEIRKLGIKVDVIDESKKSFFNIIWSTRRILSQQPPDVIHSHRYKENILAYLTSRSFPGVKLVGTEHGLVELRGRKTSPKQRVISKCNIFVLSRYFHHVVGVCRDIQEAFLNSGLREDKTSVIHNGIEISNTPQKTKNGETFVIGSSGRIFPIKDYPFMIEVARGIREKTNHICFQLAGQGPEQPKIQALVHEHNLEGVFELKGYLEDISTFYGKLDLYLNTSVHEGIPMSVLEAMAHGLPVIGPKVGGLAEIIDDGIQGYLLEEKDPKAYAEKCLLLYENKALRKNMSMAAKEKVKRSFSVKNMVQRYFSLYVDVTQNA